jgi:hypothetical protein
MSVEDYRGYGLAFARNKSNLRKTHIGLEIEGVGLVSEAKALPITAQCPIWSPRGWVARSSQAPVLILTAPDALTPTIAMAVRPAAA